ncbi:MAG: TraB/GumN family protein [Paludibacteraceae bacterium]|nr:TraB/GumN family protein [Paludibacteraceae bacterium]
MLKVLKIEIISLIIILVAPVASAQVLYRISSNSTAAPSYILATNKLMDMTFIDTIPNVFKCFSNCNKVITEFAMQDYEAIAELRQAALLPDSIRLSNFYTEEQYKAINDALLINLGMGLEQLGRMKPAYLTEMFRNELLKKWLDYNDERSMETFFEAVAIQNNTPIYGLDNIKETMYMIFDREPFHWQCEELYKIIEYPEREVGLERTLKNMYSYGRLTDMAYAVKGPDNLSTLSYSDYQIFAKRNKEWVKRLRPYLAEGNAFITLNAIYLGGEDGLLAQLRAAGYRVKAVNK